MKTLESTYATNSDSQKLSAGSQAFLATYPADFSLDQHLHLLPHTSQPRTIAENPRILGKLHFRLLQPLSSAPQTFQELRMLVEQGVVDCIDGIDIASYIGEWNTQYTNATAEKSLKAATTNFTDATYAIFPISMRQRKEAQSSVPEILFLDTDHCLSPTQPTSTRLFNNVIAAKGLVGPDDIVLDMCAGSGISALVAAYMMQNGRGHVYALDLMEQAVSAIQHNTSLHHFEEKITPLQSDMFEALPQDMKVDTIFINPPFYPKNHQSTHPADLDEAVSDGEFSVIRRLFADAPKYLKKGGKIYALYEDLEKFPGKKNAIEYFADLYNHRRDREGHYTITPLAQIRRARVDEEGNPTSIAFAVYEITLS